MGRTLAGGYLILEAIGAGGMGRVYRAEQTSLGKTLAIKVIHPHLAGDDNAVARFYAEARACSRINHPNAVSVLDFGRTDDNLLYLVMEFLRGRDLSRVVWEAGALRWDRSAEIIRQVLAALSEAHEQGVIHRDIKPENILVEPLRTGGDFVKVVDFGLAKIRTDASPGVTSPGLVCGTPDYMAPEQGRGLPPDPRSDLYSAAVVLYYCVTGRLPFDAELPQQVLLMHVNDPVPDPRQFVPDLPAHFVEVLLRGLEKDPDIRYGTAVDFAAALQAAVAPHRPAVRGGAHCPRCGSAVAAGLKFCGECGARVSPGARNADGNDLVGEGRKPQRVAVSTTTSSLGAMPLVGRAEDFERLRGAWDATVQGRLRVVSIAGEEGVGRRRLAMALVEHAASRGATTVTVGPDATWAGVAYAPLARCIRALIGLRAEQSPVEWYDENFAVGDPEHEPAVRSGLVEVFSAEGAEDLGVQPRLEAATRALEFALREAARTSSSPPVVLFDQLHRIDSASVRVLATLAVRSSEIAACVVLTHTPRFQRVRAVTDAIALRGLSREQAREAAVAARPGQDPAELLEHLPAEVLPLHLEQRLRWHIEGGNAAPDRLVDVIAARLERLSVKARRVLQALAVLGEETTPTVAQVVGSGGDVSTVRMLAERGWLVVENRDTEQYLSIAHPLLREVVDASMPSTLRRELHLACLAALGDREVPLEVRALHAEHTNDAFGTLLLLERMGDRSLARGDDMAAAQALRRGLEFARREFALGDTDSEGAIVIFTRKLGQALVRSGDYAEAEGVLREGLSVATRGTVEWARLEGILGRALCSRGRQAEGLRAIDNAVTVASRHGAASLVSDLLVSRADMEAVVRDYRDAVRAVEAGGARPPHALRLTPSNPALQRQRAELLVRLARARRLAEIDDERGLLEARDLAEALGLGILLARCDEEVAERAEATGDRAAATRAWERAAERAREAGDAALEGAYLERSRLLSRVEVVSPASAVVAR